MAVLVLEKTAVKRLLLPKIVKSFVHPYRLGLIEFKKFSFSHHELVRQEVAWLPYIS